MSREDDFDDIIDSPETDAGQDDSGEVLVDETSESTGEEPEEIDILIDTDEAEISAPQAPIAETKPAKKKKKAASKPQAKKKKAAKPARRPAAKKKKVAKKKVAKKKVPKKKAKPAPKKKARKKR